MNIDPSGMVGALLVALGNWFFMKRWIDSIDARFEKQELRNERQEKAIADARLEATSAKTRTVLIQQALQLKHCFDGSECPNDERDSNPPVRAGHRARA